MRFKRPGHTANNQAAASLFPEVGLPLQCPGVMGTIWVSVPWIVFPLSHCVEHPALGLLQRIRGEKLTEEMEVQLCGLCTHTHMCAGWRWG